MLLQLPQLFLQMGFTHTLHKQTIIQTHACMNAGTHTHTRTHTYTHTHNTHTHTLPTLVCEGLRRLRGWQTHTEHFGWSSPPIPPRQMEYPPPCSTSVWGST